MALFQTWFWFFWTLELMILLILGVPTLICLYFYYSERNSPFLRSRYPQIAFLQIVGLLVYNLGRFVTMFRFFWTRTLINTPYWYRIIDLLIFGFGIRTTVVSSIFRIYSLKKKKKYKNFS